MNSLGGFQGRNLAHAQVASSTSMSWKVVPASPTKELKCKMSTQVGKRMQSCPMTCRSNLPRWQSGTRVMSWFRPLLLAAWPTFRHARACPTKGTRIKSSSTHKKVWKSGKQSQRHSTNTHQTFPFHQDLQHVANSIQSQQRPARNQSNASSNATLTRQSTRRLPKEMKSPASSACRAAIPACSED